MSVATLWTASHYPRQRPSPMNRMASIAKRMQRSAFQGFEMGMNLLLAAVLEGNAEDCGTQVWVDGRFIPIAPLGKHLLRGLDDSIMSASFLRCGDTLGHQRGRPWRTYTARLKSKIYKKRGVGGLDEDTDLKRRRIWSSSGVNSHPRDLALGPASSLVNAINASRTSFDSNIHAFLSMPRRLSISSHTLPLTPKRTKHIE